MRKIILDLLEFSRVGKHDEKLSKINIDEVVYEVCLLHRKLIEEKKAIIKYESLPEIINYRSPIIQIFQNLIGNALKYSKDGVQPVIEIDGQENDLEWTFSIKDNGIGIKKDYYDRIFIIFQRLHNKEDYSGTGMGLSIVKKIIDQLKGSISVDSEEGVGTTFTFSIPK